MQKFTVMFVAAVLLVLCFTAKAQDVEVHWGPTVKAPYKSAIKGLVGVDENGLYALQTQRKGIPFIYLPKSTYHLVRYDQEFNLDYSKEIKWPGPNYKDVKLENLYYMQGQLVMFTSYLNKKNKNNSALATKIDDKGKVDRKLQELDKIQAKNKRKTGGFEFILSNDSSKILVYSDKPFDRKEDEKFGIKIYDNNLNELHALEVELPYADKEVGILDKMVSNSGNVFLLLRVNKEKSERSRKTQSYFYKVVRVDPATAEVDEYDLTLGTKYISEIGLRIDDKGDLITAGMYSDKSGSMAKGIFYMKLDGATKEIISTGTQAFDRNFIAEVRGKKKAKAGKELSNFRLDHLEFLADGSAVMVAEQFYIIRTETQTSAGVTVVTYHYYHNDIIVANIGTDGEIKWVSRVPKRQHTVNQDFYSGYAFGHNKNNLYFIYNDHKKNVKVTDPRKLWYFGKPSKSVVMLATIDSKGDMEKTPLFRAKEQKTYTVPKLTFQSASNEMIIYGVKGRNTKFGKVTMY